MEIIFYEPHTNNVCIETNKLTDNELDYMIKIQAELFNRTVMLKSKNSLYTDAIVKDLLTL